MSTRRWVVFFGTDYMVEAETPEEAAEEYADKNGAEVGHTLVVVESGVPGAEMHRFRIGVAPLRGAQE